MASVKIVFMYFIIVICVILNVFARTTLSPEILKEPLAIQSDDYPILHTNGAETFPPTTDVKDVLTKIVASVLGNNDTYFIKRIEKYEGAGPLTKVLSTDEVSDPELKEDINESFSKLLKILLDVNEQKVSAMKKYTELQDYVLTKNKLRNVNNLSNKDDNNRISLRWKDDLSNNKASDEIVKNDIKESFHNLLRLIVDVNEQRLAALIKYSQLQDYLLSRTIHNDFQVFWAWNEVLPNKRTKKFITNNNKLKQNVADRNGAKPRLLCIMACYRTIKNLCETSKCDVKMTQKDITRIRENCRRNCASLFGL